MITRKQYDKFQFITGNKPLSGNEWGKWNMTIHPEEEVLYWAIRDILHQEHNFCYTMYASVPDSLNTELVDELFFIQSGFFCFDGYCEKTRDFIFDLAKKGHVNIYAQIETVIKDSSFPIAFRKKCKQQTTSSINLIKEKCDRRQKDIDLTDRTIQFITQKKNDLLNDINLLYPDWPQDKFENYNKYLLKLDRNLGKQQELLKKAQQELMDNNAHILRLINRTPWNDLAYYQSLVPKEYFEKRNKIIKKDLGEREYTTLWNNLNRRSAPLELKEYFEPDEVSTQEDYKKIAIDYDD